MDEAVLEKHVARAGLKLIRLPAHNDDEVLYKLADAHSGELLKPDRPMTGEEVLAECAMREQ